MPTPSRRAPLNLAALVPELPAVILPNGKEVQMVPFTAEAYEKFRLVQNMTRALMDGENISEMDYYDLLDELVKLVLPAATPDDLASLGARMELKMSIVTAASGKVDEVLEALSAATGKPEGNGEALPPSIQSMTSAAPSPATRKHLDKTG